MFRSKSMGHVGCASGHVRLAAHDTALEIAERRVALVRKQKRSRNAGGPCPCCRQTCGGGNGTETRRTLSLTKAFIDPPFALIERSAVPFFGVRASGVHEWLCPHDDGIYVVARRARDKMTYPGMLDNTVAVASPWLGPQNMIGTWRRSRYPRGTQHVIPVGFIDYAHDR